MMNEVNPNNGSLSSDFYDGLEEALEHEEGKETSIQIHEFEFIRDEQKRGTQVTSLPISNIEDDIKLEEIKRNLGHDMSTAVKEIAEEIYDATLRNIIDEAERKEIDE